MRSALAFLVAAALGATSPTYAHGIWTETAPGGGTRVTVIAVGLGVTLGHSSQ